MYRRNFRGHDSVAPECEIVAQALACENADVIRVAGGFTLLYWLTGTRVRLKK